MKLIFIHGWGFDASFWDDVLHSMPISDHSIHRWDLGFCGRRSTMAEFNALEAGDNSVLIGHSLGFLHGLVHLPLVKGRIAINAFPFFVDKVDQKGCVSSAVLRDLRRRLSQDAAKALHSFYDFIKAIPPSLPPHEEMLREGLEFLEAYDGRPLLEKALGPSLFLASCFDPLVPALVSQYMDRYGVLVMKESDSHVLPQKEPAFCGDQIARFLQKNFG